MRGVSKELPQGWVEATIGDLTIDKVPQTVPSSASLFTYIDISGIENESKQITPKQLPGDQAPSRARQLIRAQDVLVSMTRPNLNAVAIVPDGLDNSIASTGFDVLRAIEIEPRWLFSHVRSQDFVREMAGLVQGALYPAIKSSDVRSYCIPVPPLNEQNRIVARIEELQAHSRRAREAMETVPDLLEQLRQSVLASAFRGDLTKEWRKKNPHVEPASELFKRIRAEHRRRWEEAELEKLKAKGLTGEELDAEFSKRGKQYKEPIPVDTTDLPELPETWCWASVDELSYSLDYGSSSKSSKIGKIPVLRMGNLQYGEIDWSDLVYTSNNFEIEKYRLFPNTVLFNRTNSPELVGKTGIYRGEQEAIFAGYLIRIQQVPQVRASYLNLMLNSPFIKILCLMVKSDAVSQSNINANKLSNFPIPLCSEEEQEVIVSKAEQVLAGTNKRKRWVSDTLGTLNQLDQSILAKAFQGELVPQDPTDEPASVLLERIREEKTRMAAKQQINLKQRGMKKMGRKRRLGGSPGAVHADRRRPGEEKETSHVKQEVD
jgi:type I restriction enzyme S subunit